MSQAAAARAGAAGLIIRSFPAARRLCALFAVQVVQGDILEAGHVVKVEHVVFHLELGVHFVARLGSMAVLGVLAGGFGRGRRRWF